MLRSLVAALFSAASLSAQSITLTPAERNQDSEWLASLGIKVPESGISLEHPYDQPFSRRSYVTPTDWFRATPPETLRADLLRKDLPILRTAMERVYGGWQLAEQRGWKWDRFFEEWDSMLMARGSESLPTREALAPWAKFMEFQLDNHSGPLGSVRFGAGSCVSVLSDAPRAACTELRNSKGTTFTLAAEDAAQRPKKASTAAGAVVHYIAYPQTRGEVTGVRCGAGWIVAEPAWQPGDQDRFANIRALSQTEKDVPSFRSVTPRIGYLRLPTFSKANGELIRQLARTVKGKVGKEELLIVDLRANDGGDAQIEILENWVDLSPGGPAWKASQRLANSCLYDALRWGYTQVSSQNLRPPVSSDLRQMLQNQVNALFKTNAAGCQASFEERRSKWHYPDHLFPSRPRGRTRIVAVVDNACGSDCEFAAYVIAATPGSVIAGVNTYGVSQFMQPGYFVLPNTRQGFRIALGTSNLYGDHRSMDGYGLDVDVLLPTRESQSPEGILKLAEKWLPSSSGR